MGWFLRREVKGGKARRRKRGKGKSAGRWDPRRTYAALKVLGVIAALVAVAVAWRASEVALVGYARELRASPVTADKVLLAGAPQWVDGALAERLRQQVAAHVAPDPFDDEGLTRAAEALRGEPWLAEVVQVRRTPGAVVVEGTYRRPAAVVMARDGFHVIAEDSVRVAGPTRLSAVPAGLPLLQGVSSAPPALGQKWDDRELQAGLELVGVLAGEAFFGQVTAIDVGHRDPWTNKQSLVLLTDAGRVEWGRPPSDAWSVSEVSTAEKLDRLETLAERYLGRIDAGGRSVRINGAAITFDEQPGGAVRVSPVSER